MSDQKSTNDKKNQDKSTLAGKDTAKSPKGALDDKDLNKVTGGLPGHRPPGS